MYYIDFVVFMDNPDKTWDDILARHTQKAPPEPTLFGDYGAYFSEKEARSPFFLGFWQGGYAYFCFTGQQ